MDISNIQVGDFILRPSSKTNPKLVWFRVESIGGRMFVFANRQLMSRKFSHEVTLCMAHNIVLIAKKK